MIEFWCKIHFHVISFFVNVSFSSVDDELQLFTFVNIINKLIQSFQGIVYVIRRLSMNSQILTVAKRFMSYAGLRQRLATQNNLGNRVSLVTHKPLLLYPSFIASRVVAQPIC